MKSNFSKSFFALLCTFIFLYSPKVYSQSILNRLISLHVKQKPIGVLLKQIEAKGNFTFSYNSSSIPADSLVSLSATNWTIKEVLNVTLNNKFEYREAPGYVILRYAPLSLTLIPEKVLRNDQTYRVSGYVIDNITGIKLQNASVYDKKNLRSTLTNNEGYFKLKLKTAQPAVALTISKEMYRDTTLMVLSDVKVKSISDTSDQYTYDALYRATRARFARFLTSSRQRIQDANIGDFFANSPFQASLLPGLSSHGMMSPQVVNTVSLNAIGGYTAGVDGLEIGGVFNISKKDVRYAQFAGVFNIVGQSVTGVQGAGVFNVVLDTLTGTQLAGVLNTNLGKIDGVQAAGVLNIAHNTVEGAQLAGVANFTPKSINGTQAAGVLNIAVNTTGTQVAGVTNFTLTNVKGAQVSGVLNTAGHIQGAQISGVLNISYKRLTGSQIGLFNISNKIIGSQIGLINFADSIGGYAIGFLNLARKGGYHSITAYSTELQKFNLSLKTGTSRLYTILQVGQNMSDNEKLCSFGLGIGREIRLLKSWYINPEISHLQVYQGNWNDINFIEKLTPLLYFKPNKIISVFAGPSINAFYSNQTSRYANYAFIKDDLKSIRLADKWNGWLGWNVGISLF